MTKRFLTLIVAASLVSCATNPETGKQEWDVDTTLRALGAALGAVQQKQTPVAPDNYTTYGY